HATTYIYSLSLHDALPIFREGGRPAGLRLPAHARPPAGDAGQSPPAVLRVVHHARRLRDDHPEGAPGAPDRGQPIPKPGRGRQGDRKSTRLNSSHVAISYA